MDAEESTGLERRTFLRKAALTGLAAAWAAPIVQTVAPPAFATGDVTPAPTPTTTGDTGDDDTDTTDEETSSQDTSDEEDDAPKL
ncbi:MAG: twin-arginine translocation signal domain-containing protein [Actinomycetota bacterium]